MLAMQAVPVLWALAQIACSIFGDDTGAGIG
jgi:hypothetical protein